MYCKLVLFKLDWFYATLLHTINQKVDNVALWYPRKRVQMLTKLLHSLLDEYPRKGMKPLILLAIGYIVTSLSFSNDCFGIRLTAKVDMSLNKPNKTINQFRKTFINSIFSLMRYLLIYLNFTSPIDGA